MQRRSFDRIIDGFEILAGGFLAFVTLLTFISVMLRYLFARSIPDSYDLGALFLGILIFWGIAVASYRGEHITVDLLWSALGPRGRRVLDIFAGFVTLLGMSALTIMMAGKVLSTRADNILTFDIHLPVWVFYAVAWAGLAASLVLILVRTVRLLIAPSELAASTIHAVE